MISYTNQFKKDYKREQRSGKHRKKLEPALQKLVYLLQRDSQLPAKYCDHRLIGEWNDCRNCHLKPDRILIYRKPNKSALELVRLGSHTELGF